MIYHYQKRNLRETKEMTCEKENRKRGRSKTHKQKPVLQAELWACVPSQRKKNMCMLNS
jgi:hypothetical protein